MNSNLSGKINLWSLMRGRREVQCGIVIMGKKGQLLAENFCFFCVLFYGVYTSLIKIAWCDFPSVGSEVK